MQFDYNDIQIEGCGFRISPSQIDKFFSYPSVWYRENFLGEKNFIGSTSTVLGTIVHKVAELFALNESITKDEIDRYIDEQAEIIGEDFDEVKVKGLYPEMAEAVVNQYLIQKGKPDEVEKAVWHKVKEDIYVGGTIDAIKGDMIIDYKTASKKPRDAIPFNYLIQLMAYAWILRKQGKDINWLRLVYVVQPTKTMGVRTFIVDKQIQADDWEMIDNTLELIAETVLVQREQPELIPLLYKSMKLKEEIK